METKFAVFESFVEDYTFWEQIYCFSATKMLAIAEVSCCLSSWNVQCGPWMCRCVGYSDACRNEGYMKDMRRDYE